MESQNQTPQQGQCTNEKIVNGDLIVQLQQGYSYYGCQFIDHLSQHMIPLLELPAERGRYPSIRQKVVSSAMRFFHYATRDSKHPSPGSTLIIKSLYQFMDLRTLAALCLAVAIDANRHNDNRVSEHLYNEDTFNSVVEKMWRKLFPVVSGCVVESKVTWHPASALLNLGGSCGNQVGPPAPPDAFYWRTITIKIPQQRQDLAHAGEHLESVLNVNFFLQDGINNTDQRDIARIRSIAIAFINDWYFSPFSGDPNKFGPEQTAVCAVFTARICLGGKLKIHHPLLLDWNLKQADLSDWANLIFRFYESSWNIVTHRNPGWISTKTGENTKEGLQVWEILDLRNT